MQALTLFFRSYADKRAFLKRNRIAPGERLNETRGSLTLALEGNEELARSVYVYQAETGPAILEKAPADPDSMLHPFALPFPLENDRYTGKVNPDRQVTLELYSPVESVRDALNKFPLESVFCEAGKLRLNHTPSPELSAFVEANASNLFLVVTP